MNLMNLYVDTFNAFEIKIQQLFFLTKLKATQLKIVYDKVNGHKTRIMK